MAHLVLIACGKRKHSSACQAADLYQGDLFRKSLAYARQLAPDGIFILSAKHGLVGLETVIEPYEQTLNTMSAPQRRAWAGRVLSQLQRVSDISRDRFTFLAGQRYRERLEPHLEHVEAPLAGMKIGEQLQWLSHCPAEADDICQQLHAWFRRQQRWRFPFDPDQLPRNGIYILFEQGEQGHGGERIVRIGTHNGQNQLRSRLKQHFIKPNKDRSIFRKNIGRCLLSRAEDPYLDVWDLCLTSRKARQQYGHLVEVPKQAALEQQVSKIIQQRLSFTVLPVPTKAERLLLESRLIATVSRCTYCGPGPQWLGRFSPKRKIRESGLWQVNEL